MNKQTFEQKISCNYSHKTSEMILSIVDPEGNTHTIEPQDVDQLIMLINYCFNTRNGFFITSFNKNLLRNVYTVYNNTKTNILDPDNSQVFKDIDIHSFKTVRYICNNFVNTYFNIVSEDPVLKDYITRDSIRKIAEFFSTIIRNIESY